MVLKEARFYHFWLFLFIERVNIVNFKLEIFHRQEAFRSSNLNRQVLCEVK